MGNTVLEARWKQDRSNTHSHNHNNTKNNTNTKEAQPTHTAHPTSTPSLFLISPSPPPTGQPALDPACLNYFESYVHFCAYTI